MTCLEATEWKSGSWGSGNSWNREKAVGGRHLGGSQLRERAWSQGHSWNNWAALGHRSPVSRGTSKGPSCIQSHLQAPTMPDTLPLEMCFVDPFQARSEGVQKLAPGTVPFYKGPRFVELFIFLALL